MVEKNRFFALYKNAMSYRRKFYGIPDFNA